MDSAWNDKENPSLLASAWRYRAIVALCAVLGALAGYGFASRQPSLYQATALVLIRPGSATGGDTTDPQRNIDNQLAVMTSTAVLQRAAETYGNGMTSDVVRTRVDVTSDQSDVISVKALDPDPRAAVRLADAVVAAYQTQGQVFDQAQAARTIARLRVDEQKLRRQLQQLTVGGATSDSDPVVKAEADAIKSRLSTIAAQRVSLSLGPEPGAAAATPLGAAEPSSGPVSPRVKLDVAIGAAAALSLALVLAWWLAGMRPAPAHARGEGADPRRHPAGSNGMVTNIGSMPGRAPEPAVADGRDPDLPAGAGSSSALE